MKSALGLYRRMLGYVAPYAGWLILSIALSLMIVVFEAMSLWFSAPLIKTLFLPESVEAPAPPSFSIAHIYEVLKYYTYEFVTRRNALSSLKIVCVLLGLSFLIKNILIYVKHLLIAALNLRVVRDMRNQVYGHALRLPVTYYDQNRSGGVMSLILNDVTSINQSMTKTFDKLLTEPMRVLFFVFMLFAISARLSLGVLVVFPLLALLISKIGAAVRRRSKRMLENLAGLLAILHETVGGIRVVKMFNTDSTESAKFREENQRFVRSSFRSTKIGRVASPLTEILGVSVAVLLLWYGGRDVLSGRGLGPEDFILFIVYLYSTFTPLKALTNINSALQTGFAAADRVFSILDTPTEPLTVSTDRAPVRISEGIRFSHVWFTYPGTEKPVLRDIDFELCKGEIVALVGPSGSGKSTILDLLPRFYEAQRGNVLIDGKDTRETNLVALRSAFGIVAQETVLFNDTVAGNIAYGTPHATEEQIIEAARAANAWEFVEKLPDGLRTMIGERGVMLSGGQRQRLAIARALLRNPPMLLLDEATSSLDTESERLVQQAINSVMANRTVLVVAHRLSTISHADQILVIEQGSIVERGTHEQLLQLGKRYRYYYDIQFSDSSAGQ